MKLKTIIPDPLKFLRAGINTTAQAAVLVHIGRTGLQGCRIDEAAASCRMSYNTVQGIAYLLLEAGYATRFSRSNRQGRAFHWVVTVKGWELLTQAPEVELFPGALDAMKGAKP